MKRVVILGASTLKRYTEGILEKGFTGNSWKIAKNDPDLVLYQIHGAPTAKDEDREIINRLKTDLSRDKGAATIVLLHRPDEIQDRHPALENILKNSRRKFGLVFFGGWHSNDSFYTSDKAIKKIIPHGFFDFEPVIQTDPIVIGTHTSWGEMRSVDHVVKLLGEIFKLKKNENIIGYIGGKPSRELEIGKLRRLAPINFEKAENFEPGGDYSTKDIIFTDNQDTQPDGLGITFNTQLYYYKEKIRTGESSGSAHTSVSIPVVLEMNNAEQIEDLKVIKIPYGSIDNIASVDFKAGAKLIIDSIQTGDYKKWLNHNLEQAKKFNNKYIAGEYIELSAKLND